MEKIGMTQNRSLIVGILPTIKLNTSEDPYEDRYEFVNNYPKKVFEAGATPLGLLLNNGKVETSSLELCDAFLWPGGSRIDKNLYQVLVHAYKEKKPVLGICMGMQAMSVFSILMSEFEKIGKKIYDVSFFEFIDCYKKMKEENPVLVSLDKPNIHSNTITRNNINHAKHMINIEKNSFLFDVYHDSAEVVSLHNVVVSHVGNLFKVTAWAEDKVIEAIESTEKSLFWIGVQFHPEIEDDNILISSFLHKIRNTDKTSIARNFCLDVKTLAKNYDLPFFVVTEGASATNNQNSKAVARENHKKWETLNGYDPEEDWSEKNARDS